MRTFALTFTALCGAVLLLLALFLSLGQRPTIAFASVRTLFASSPAGQALWASQAQTPTLVSRLTVGTKADGCARTNEITVPLNSPVYFCLQLTNKGAVTLTQHIFASDQMLDGDAPLNQTLLYYLGPGVTKVITDSFLAQVGFVHPFMTQRANPSTSTVILGIDSSNDNGVFARTTATATVHIGLTGIRLAKNINLKSSDCLAQTNVIVSENQPIYECIQLTNMGAVTLTHHVFSDTTPQGTNKWEFDYRLAPSQTLELKKDSLLSTLGVTSAGVPALGPFLAQVTATLPLKVKSTNSAGYEAVAAPAITPTLNVPLAPLLVELYLFVTGNNCQRFQTGYTINYGTSVLYCLYLVNLTSAPLTHHKFGLYVEPPSRAGSTYLYSGTVEFDTVLTTNVPLQVNNAFLTATVKTSNILGPITITAPFTPSKILTSTLYYTATNPNLSLQLVRKVVATLPLAPQPTQTATATSTPSATDASTPTPPPGATATQPITTATATATWTPIAVSVMIAPTPTPQPHVREVASPLPGQFNSPIGTPTPPPVAPSFLETPTFTPDFAVLAATQTADSAATMMMMAQQFTPTLTFTPPGTDTPTATPTATPSPTTTPTDTPTPTITQRPIALANTTPVASSDRSALVGEMMNTAVVAAGWVWFALGSLVFFVVAGVVAGLSFRQGERRRYRLDDDFEIRPSDAQAPQSPPSPAQPKDEDDNWPASLP